MVEPFAHEGLPDPGDRVARAASVNGHDVLHRRLSIALGGATLEQGDSCNRESVHRLPVKPGPLKRTEWRMSVPTFMSAFNATPRTKERAGFVKADGAPLCHSQVVQRYAGMDFGVHLPLMDFGDQGLSRERLERTVDAARECGFAAVSANDHFIFSTPWLDGPTALAAMVERSGDMVLATTLSLAALRGPVPLAKALSALDVLSDGASSPASDRALQGVTMTRWGCPSTTGGNASTRRSRCSGACCGAMNGPTLEGISPHPSLGSRRHRCKPVVFPSG